jgi:hypothetical protein
MVQRMVPPAEAYDDKTYETENVFIFYNSFRPIKGSFEIVRDHIVALIKKFSDSKSIE